MSFLGALVDMIATICHVSNDNNKMGAPKLRLFKKSNLENVTDDLSDNIGDLMCKGKLVNGETLILKYVD